MNKHLNKTIFISGIFNVIHPGHLRLLKSANEMGGKLIVGILSDVIGGSAVHLREDMRLEAVKSISWVADAFIIREDIESIIERVKPDIVLKGNEHRYKSNPEKKPLEKYGGELIFTSGEEFFSSSDLLNKESELATKDTRITNFYKAKSFIERHNINRKSILSLFDKFKSLNIVVIGDLIIDEYINCQALGMSQEDPTLVVTPVETTKYLGGAGIVAAHAAALGSNVNFISVAGNDFNCDFAIKKLNDFNVSTHIYRDKFRQTTLKQRFRSNNKTLLRVSHLNQMAISENIESEILKKLDTFKDDIDIIIFSDFNYGSLPQSLVLKILNNPNFKNVFISADSQSSSQFGDISRYKGVDLISATEREVRLAIKNHEDGLVVISDMIQEQTNSKFLFLKMGSEGLIVNDKSGDLKDWKTDKIDALNVRPIDVAGAGDSMLVLSSIIIRSGGNAWDAAYVASVASAIQVSRVGNLPVSLDELTAEIL